MIRIDKNGEIKTEDLNNVFNDVFENHNTNYHYLAFDRQIAGFSPLGTFVKDETIRQNEANIIGELIKRQEVCSLYPKLNLTLYPIQKITNVDYVVDLKNIKKHFKDILDLNDNVYKTKYMFVDYGHGAQNMDKTLVEKHLRALLKKASFLKPFTLNNIKNL